MTKVLGQLRGVGVCEGSHLAAQDKLEPSEGLGDLLKRAGDADAALACYQKANVPGKVIEGLAAKGDFEALSKFTAAQARAARLQPLQSLHCGGSEVRRQDLQGTGCLI